MRDEWEGFGPPFFRLEFVGLYSNLLRKSDPGRLRRPFGALPRAARPPRFKEPKKQQGFVNRVRLTLTDGQD